MPLNKETNRLPPLLAMLPAQFYLSESKVLQYFGNVRHNSAAADAFTEGVKVMNHNGLWDAELAWYSLSATHWICHGREEDEPY